MAITTRRTAVLAVATLAAALHACAGLGAAAGGKETPMLDAPSAGNPNFRYRIDAFQVPEGSRAEFEEAMNRSMRFLLTLPGCRGHAVFVKAAGPTRFDVITVATWESQEAIDRAGDRVRAYYRELGFDPAASMARWGVKAEIGYFSPAPVGE
jgi:hypothetical protein